MYARLIRFVTNRNVQLSTVYPVSPSSSSLSISISTQSNYKNRNLVDDIRESASGLPPTPPSSSRAEDSVNNVVKRSTTPPRSSSPYDEEGRKEGEGDTKNFVVEGMKQGVVKAMETGVNVGEMAKQTLDNVWDVTKDTTHKVKEVVGGEADKKKYDVPPSDHFVEDLRKRADGYDQTSNRDKGGGI